MMCIQIIQLPFIAGYVAPSHSKKCGAFPQQFMQPSHGNLWSLADTHAMPY